MWLSDSATSVPRHDQSVLRVGLVGAGLVSAYHLRTLKRLTNVKVVGVADLIRERAESAASRFQIPGVHISIEALLEDNIDVLHVLTPTSTHFELALKGIKAGSNVFVEKPFTCSVQQCRRLVEEARLRKRRISVDHSLLSDQTVVKGLELVRQGLLGNVVSVRFHRTGMAPNRPHYRLPYPLDGDPFREVGVHALYLVAAVLGSIRDASCGFRSTGYQTDFNNDEWCVQLACETGLAQIHLSWNGPAQQTLEICGIDGRLKIDISSGQLLRRRFWKGSNAVQLAVNPTIEAVTGIFQVGSRVAGFMTGRVKAYQGIDGMIRKFYRALREGTPMPVSVSELLNIVTWTEQIAKVAENSVACSPETVPCLPIKSG